MKKLSIIITALIIPVFLTLGYIFFNLGYYNLLGVFTTVAVCVIFFMYFERKHTEPCVLVLIAVFTALSVAGRIMFAPIPGFKPVTAVVVIAAVYFGPAAGFMIGSLSAFVSNLYFGQGPWTPLQMFAWGIIGLIAGVISNPLLKSRVLMLVYAVFSGVLFSLIMDIWTTLFAEKTFNFTRYIAVLATSLPFTVVYAFSNVVFMIILMPLVSKKLQRIKIKYGI
ncbi:MAG: ECF transporter S component [Ruminococcaceae bacterium]|nr:ECF transporter S component [Oscillospiraceae bacterium]